MISKHLLFWLLLLAGWQELAAQPFRKEIDAFLKADSMARPAKGQILFTGSSSFTYWKDIAQYFPGYSILNRGFGGSSLTDLVRYAKEVIIPYQPRQIVIYCGENDLADSSQPNPPKVFKRFRQLFHLIRSSLGEVPIVYVSIKPSPSRWPLEAKMVRTNQLIQRFLQRYTATAYVDVHRLMLEADGKVMPHLFLGDKLHMNAQGYAIWKEAITPYLLR